MNLKDEIVVGEPYAREFKRVGPKGLVDTVRHFGLIQVRQAKLGMDY